MTSQTESEETSQSYVSNRQETQGILTFTLKDINLSFANALRRTIVSNIPTAAFRVFPYAKNETNIVANTSRLNNEILKQRLGCIPIHITDHSLPFRELQVELEAKNTTDDIMYITTEHFKVKNTRSEKYLEHEVVHKMFPPDPLTGDYILFARLRPKLSDEVPGEEINLTAKISLQTAKEDGMYNVSTTCSYGMTPDKSRQDAEWDKKLHSIDQHQETPESITLIQQDWYNLEAKRVFIENSFDFVIESVGVFHNTELVRKACDILNHRLQTIATAAADQKLPIKESVSTLPNSFDITLENEDYSVGKMIEYVLHDTYYRKMKVLSYVGFRKKHPHDTDSIIRLSFKNESDQLAAQAAVQDACTKAAETINNISKEF